MTLSSIIINRTGRRWGAAGGPDPAACAGSTAAVARRRYRVFVDRKRRGGVWPRPEDVSGDMAGHDPTLIFFGDHHGLKLSLPE